MSIQIVNDVGGQISAPRLELIREFFAAYLDGFWTANELASHLDANQIRGTWSNTNWTGYDYSEQGWVVVTVPANA